MVELLKEPTVRVTPASLQVPHSEDATKERMSVGHMMDARFAAIKERLPLARILHQPLAVDKAGDTTQQGTTHPREKRNNKARKASVTNACKLPTAAEVALTIPATGDDEWITSFSDQKEEENQISPSPFLQQFCNHNTGEIRRGFKSPCSSPDGLQCS